MKVTQSKVFSEVFSIAQPCYGDARGFFTESFKDSTFREFFKRYPVQHTPTPVQTNVSLSQQGVIRGLHFQKMPHAQAKWISCLQGQMLDIVLDIRPDSDTFGQWEAFVLNAPGGTLSSLYIPMGFAHGFEALTHQTLMQYTVFGAEYTPAAEAGIAYNDPLLKLPWNTQTPQVSEKDQRWPGFEQWCKSQ